MAGQIVLFGATGYTGALVAEELAARGVSAVLAGRNPGRLDALAARLNGTFTVATADVGDPASITALLGRRDILVSTVGPFLRFGDPAVEAAITRRAAYLDSTGEPAFVRRVFDDYGPAAEAAGVVLLPAFGYDCVPGHVAGAMALEAGGDRAVQVDIGYFSAGGGWSAGTLASLLGAARAPHFAWRDGELVTERGGARTATFRVRGASAAGLSFGGSEHLALPRSYPRLRTVGTYLGWFGALTQAVRVAGAGQAAVERLPGVPALFDRILPLLTPAAGGGPDAAARARTRSTFIAVARDAAGAQLASVRLSGVDGYTLTARLLVWGALQLQRGERPPAGARGPIEAFGLPAMTAALADAGLVRKRG